MPRGTIQTRAFAIRAGLAIEELGQLLTHGTRFGFAIASVEIRQYAFEAMQFLDLQAARISVVKFDLLLATAVQNNVLQLLVEVAERRFNVELVVIRKALDHLVVIGCLAIPAAYRAPGE